jgi:hypothetical protein
MGTPPEWLLRLSSVTRLSAKLLTRGFASQPHDWFAIIGEGSKSNLLESAESKVSARALDRVQEDCLSLLVVD